MASIPKCFGALVASGNGNRCNDFKSILRNVILIKNKNSTKSGVWIFKNGSDKYLKEYNEFVEELSSNTDSLWEGMPMFLLENKFYFGQSMIGDKEWENELEQWHFSDILDSAMRKGKWNGGIGNS